MTRLANDGNPSPVSTTLGGSKILIIDDDPDLLGVLREWFSFFCPEVHTAPNGATALALAKKNVFDVALTDLEMPGIDGIQLLSLLKEIDPALAVVFLTGRGTMEDAIIALRAGRAFDFLLKPVRDFNELNAVVVRAIAHTRQQVGRACSATPGHREVLVDPLSPRELAVVALLAEGLDNRQIAERLILGEKTIKNYLTRIYEKLRVSNRTQAVLVCQRHGLLPH